MSLTAGLTFPFIFPVLSITFWASVENCCATLATIFRAFAIFRSPPFDGDGAHLPVFIDFAKSSMEL